MSIHQINSFIPTSSFISKIYQIIDKISKVSVFNYSTTLNSKIIADFHFIQTKSSILLSIKEKRTKTLGKPVHFDLS